MADGIYDKVLTIEETIEKHRKMWNWVADNCNEKTGKSVYELIKMFIHNNEENPNLFVNSYCCEYAAQQVGRRNHYMGRCRYCPLDWGSQRSMYGCQHLIDESQEDGLYIRAIRLSDNGNYEEAQKVAREIANLLENKSLEKLLYYQKKDNKEDNVMSELTKEQAIAEHRKMWTWIAEHCNKETGKDVAQLKIDYLKENNIENLLNNCFCCQYSKQANYGDEIDMCEHCPLDWGCPAHDGMYYCEDTDEDFNGDGLWAKAKDLSCAGQFKEAQKIALQIANLPEKI